MTIYEPPRTSFEECVEINDSETGHPTDVVMSCSPDSVLTHDGQTSQACRRCHCGRASQHVDLCNRPEAVERRAEKQRARDALAARPLGIADLNRAYVQVKYQDLPDHWYWCRRHSPKQGPVHASKECKGAGGYLPTGDLPGDGCIRVGPFMSEREAQRLGGFLTYSDGDARALGMEVEQ